MSTLQLYLFGSPRLELDGEALPVSRRKGMALLAYLALSGQPQSRETLATMLWPDSDQSGALSNLRRELSLWRSTGGPELLTADRRQVELLSAAPLVVDVLRFRELFAALTNHNDFPEQPCDHCLAALTEASELYTDRFMAGFTLPDSPEFDQWQFFEAEGLQRVFADGLQKLIQWHAAQSEFERAVDYANRWLQLDPLHEPAHRTLMRLYAQSGQRAAALRQFEVCRRELGEELGLEPDAETQALYEAIHNRRYPPVTTQPTPPLVKPVSQRYMLDEALARGGQGELFRGRDLQTDRPVVVKRIPRDLLGDEERVRRFRREGETLRQLNHPNIVRLLDTFEDEGRHCLVMEYVPGGTLADLIAAEGPLPLERMLSLSLELADALVRAHHLGIVHRDLKPANVLIAADGTPRLTDFGLVRYQSDELHLTQTGTLVGSPLYMSPEALRGEELDGRSDIWSFGIILHEMLTGGHPFAANQLAQALVTILTQPIPSLSEARPELPAPLVALVRRMLAKERSSRIPSMRLVAAGLEAVRDARVSAQPPLAASLQAPLPSASATLPPSTVTPAPAAPLVAREAELERLTTALERALAGQSTVLFVTGEAGRGKTSLMQSFSRQAQARHPELLVAAGECDAFTGAGDVFLPFREILEQLTGSARALAAVASHDPVRSERLRQALPQALQALLQEGPELIGALLSGSSLVARAKAVSPLVTPWLSQLETLLERPKAAAGSVQQAALIDQYCQVLRTLSAERPLLLFVDDLQWVDTGSATLLFHLARRLSGTRIFIVGAYRPTEVNLGRAGGRHPLQQVVNELRRQFGENTIDLEQTEGQRLVGDLLATGEYAVDDGFAEQLYRRTGGHPLFTVEILQELKSRGALTRDAEGRWVAGANIDWDVLPARVEGVVAERIERLPPELQELLRVASVAGEQFFAQVIAQVQQLDERDVIRQLSQQLDRQHALVRAEGNEDAGARRLSRYRFRHSLFQRYLYQELDEVERAFLHEAVAQELENLYGGQASRHAVELAWHYGQAGRSQAIPYLREAGEQAMYRGAYQEGISYLEDGLAALLREPESRRRAEEELQFRLRLGPALGSTRGWAVPEVEATYMRALSLAEEEPDPLALSQVLYGLAMIREYTGEYERTERLLSRQLRLAQVEQHPVMQMESNELMACSTYHQGKFSEAVRHADAVCRLYDSRRHDRHIPMHGRNLQISGNNWAAHALFFAGYPDRALERLHNALRLAGELSHEHFLVHAWVEAAFHYQFRREAVRVRGWTTKAFQPARKLGLELRLAESTMLHGWAQAALGEPRAGLDQLQRGLQEYRARGYKVDEPYFLALRAELFAQLEDYEGALASLEEASALLPPGRHFFYEPEFARLRGTLGSAMGARVAQVEEHFLQAVEVARRQGSPLLALRAAVNLAELWRANEHEAQARDYLADIYAEFGEGFETPDLAAAARLGTHMGLTFRTGVATVGG